MATVLDGSGADWCGANRVPQSPAVLGELRRLIRSLDGLLGYQKLLAYVDGISGELLWQREGHKVSSYWKRVPSEDKEVEIEP